MFHNLFFQALLTNFARGEARLDIADAALQIAAEDDAIVTHSPVPLPVGEFTKRISRLANDLGHRVLPELDPKERNPADVIRVRVDTSPTQCSERRVTQLQAQGLWLHENKL